MLADPLCIITFAPLVGVETRLRFVFLALVIGLPDSFGQRWDACLCEGKATQHKNQTTKKPRSTFNPNPKLSKVLDREYTDWGLVLSLIEMFMVVVKDMVDIRNGLQRDQVRLERGSLGTIPFMPNTELATRLLSFNSSGSR